MFCFSRCAPQSGALWAPIDSGNGGAKSKARRSKSVTILTTSAIELVKPFHDRMPVIMSTADNDAWLDPATTDATKLSYLFEPFPAIDMVARPVNPMVNNAGLNVPECIEPVRVE